MTVKCDSCQACTINGRPCHETGCTGRFTLEENGKSFALYKVFSLDVWGNEKEGFDVNDRSSLGNITLPLDADDRTLVKGLKSEGIIGKFCKTKSFSIDGDDYSLNIDWASNSRPLFTLERL